MLFLLFSEDLTTNFVRQILDVIFASNKALFRKAKSSFYLR